MLDTKAERHPVDDLTLGTPYADGEVIFHEGDECDAVYVVQSGKVRAVTVQPSGREIEISIAEPGDIFGVTSLFDNSPRSTSTVAVGQTRILKLSRSRIIKAIHEDPTLGFFILKTIAQRAIKLKKDLVKSESRYQR